jgi:replication factor C subunit 2/4
MDLVIDFECENNGDTKFNNDIQLPWVEKYRPKLINDVVLDNDINVKLNEIVATKNIPNIIISGPPGVGKTSTIICLAKQVSGKYYKQGIIELNASDNRGIDVINNTIIHFCKKKLQYHDGNKYIDITKIVILDEADNITTKAQPIICQLIDDYPNTRFVFTCNDSSKIIEGIQSRCVLMRYPKMQAENMRTRLKIIADYEEVEHTEEGLNEIINVAQGDMRQAINNMEAVFHGYGEVNIDTVYKICDRPEPMLIANIINVCMANNLTSGIAQVNELIARGYYSNDIILAMMNLLNNSSTNDSLRMKYITQTNNAYIIVNENIDSKLQLHNLIAKLIACND